MLPINTHKKVSLLFFVFNRGLLTLICTYLASTFPFNLHVYWAWNSTREHVIWRNYWFHANGCDVLGTSLLYISAVTSSAASLKAHSAPLRVARISQITFHFHFQAAVAHTTVSHSGTPPHPTSCPHFYFQCYLLPVLSDPTLTLGGQGSTPEGQSTITRADLKLFPTTF